MKQHRFFLNLPVASLETTKAFFASLGFTFDPRFTDENAACMVLSDLGYVMLLNTTFFKTFSTRELCDTSKHIEGLFAFQVDSREEVEAIVTKALANGGKPAMKANDHGFMYQWSFLDPDGHQWEVFWMDPNAVPPQQS